MMFIETLKHTHIQKEKKEPRAKKSNSKEENKKEKKQRQKKKKGEHNDTSSLGLPHLTLPPFSRKSKYRLSSYQQLTDPLT
jgi:uncharacterized Zn-finger protein